MVRVYDQRRKEANQRWYQRNKKEVLGKDKRIRADRIKQDPAGLMLHSAKSSAKKKGLEFNLSREDISIPTICPILLIPLKFGSYSERGSSPSVDRIDNTKGYIKGNIGIISFRANQHKSNMSKDDIQRLWEYVNS